MKLPIKLALAVLLGSVLPLAAAAQTAEQFYKGRSVTLLVGFAPGGINDISARLVGKHLGRFIPGNPTIVVQNNPGRRRLVAGNRLYNVAEKDGSVIAGLGRSVPQLAIQGEPNASFDPQKFTWLGSLSAYTQRRLPADGDRAPSGEDRRGLNKPGMAVNLGADRAGATNVSFSLIAKEVLGLQVNLVRGYQGAAPIFLAMQRGEVDGQVIGLSSILAGQRALWDGKELRPLLQFGRLTRLPELPDVPTGREIAKDARRRRCSSSPSCRSSWRCRSRRRPACRPTAPRRCKRPSWRCAATRLRRRGRRLGLDVSPIDGEKIASLLASAAATPKDVIDRFNEIEKK